MAKIAQLIEGNYNILDNIPVINQDLTASGFTPVANTYYRHTGVTTPSFTQGIIYLYDTAYHKLGESGGGTTLNKYTYNTSFGSQSNTKIINILRNAKSVAQIEVGGMASYCVGDGGVNNFGASIWGWTTDYSTGRITLVQYMFVSYDKTILYETMFSNQGSISITETQSPTYGELRIVYYNDTEI